MFGQQRNPANVPSYAMAGASEMPWIINQLHSQDNFKKCATRPFVYNDLLLICHKIDDPLSNGTNNLLPKGSGGILNPTL
jgi:hypothetical protein